MESALGAHEAPHDRTHQSHSKRLSHKNTQPHDHAHTNAVYPPKTPAIFSA